VRVKILPAPFFVLSFKVLVVVAGFGVNVAMLAAGEPLTLKLTPSAKPFRGVTETV
jgi:hypothetical protein